MAEAFQANDRKALAEDTALEFEEVAPVDGQRHTYISIKFPLRELHGAVQGVCGISTDITERVRAEQALKDGEALYHSLVECLPLNVVRKDRHGRVTFGNERFCRTLGRPLDQLLGKTDFDLFPDKLADKYVADDRRVVETGEVFEDVEEHHTPDGENLYMHVLKSPVYDAKDQIVGIQVIFWDVTDKHRAQKALQRTMADLSRSNKELEEFAYVASHDLQEPLRMIASYTQLLSRRYKDKLDKEAEEFIAFAVDGAIRMQKLINDLLSYSRVGTRGKAFSATDLEQVLQTVLTNLKIALEESGAQITHDPLPTVVADSTQMTQLLQNLIGNALKFRGERAPHIHISAQREGAAWVMGVKDNGIGIEPQYFERIFVIFQRLHTQQEYSGTGIGLAICKKIVERHGGRIWVESKPGQGATFWFTLPAALTPSSNPTS
jgi:PAS domain S-box-containing protein